MLKGPHVTRVIEVGVRTLELVHLACVVNHREVVGDRNIAVARRHNGAIGRDKGRRDERASHADAVDAAFVIHKRYGLVRRGPGNRRSWDFGIGSHVALGLERADLPSFEREEVLVEADRRSRGYRGGGPAAPNRKLARSCGCIRGRRGVSASHLGSHTTGQRATADKRRKRKRKNRTGTITAGSHARRGMHVAHIC